MHWKDLWVRFKVRPSAADLVQVVGGWVEVTLGHPSTQQLAEILDQHYSRANWTADLKRAMDEVARKIAEGASRREQARFCRRQLLNQIETVATHKVVLALDENMREYWLTVEYADKPYSADQRTNAFLVSWALGPLTQAVIHGLYVSQYNSILDEQQFSQPFQILCEAYCDVLAKTISVRSGDASFIHPLATAYDDLVAAQIEPRLREVKERLAAAVEMNDMPAILAARSAGISIGEEYRIVLERFKAAIASQ